ncbi:hypothetical protein M885DRAFT_514194 [Pelagophyceae sp. CCMP2097]|nr:hypothetical protein M885DRAFT_514194 [Pelagophyceae sp. CCMP2097]
MRWNLGKPHPAAPPSTTVYPFSPRFPLNASSSREVPTTSRKLSMSCGTSTFISARIFPVHLSAMSMSRTTMRSHARDVQRRATATRRYEPSSPMHAIIMRRTAGISCALNLGMSVMPPVYDLDPIRRSLWWRMQSSRARASASSLETAWTPP